MNRMNRFVLPALSLMSSALLIGGLAACDGPLSGDKEAPFETDCRQICEEYAECYDNDTDVGDCTAECVENSVESDNFQEQVDKCETCIDDQTCLENVFDCADDCKDVLDRSL